MKILAFVPIIIVPHVSSSGGGHGPAGPVPWGGLGILLGFLAVVISVLIYAIRKL